MITAFPTTYRDKFGTETTVIQNDGKVLSMTLRGVEFVGSMFDDFEPKNPEEPDLNSFVFNHGWLCSYEIDCEIPVLVKVAGSTIESKLHAHIELGGPKSNGRIEYERIGLELFVNEKSYKSPGQNGWFDDELWEIQKLLPHDVSIKSCYTCAYSSYHPAGYGAFGCLACFRDHKQEFWAIRTKAELMHFFSKRTENVQETWLCPEYENVQAKLGSDKSSRP
jgi:hypothetical protein